DPRQNRAVAGAEVRREELQGERLVGQAAEEVVLDPVARVQVHPHPGRDGGDEAPGRDEGAAEPAGDPVLRRVLGRAEVRPAEGVEGAGHGRDSGAGRRVPLIISGRPAPGNGAGRGRAEACSSGPPTGRPTTTTRSRSTSAPRGCSTAGPWPRRGS